MVHKGSKLRKDSTVVIGDVHGSDYWKEVIKENPDCRYVFLGDYLDPYEEMDSKILVGNLKDIIQLKREQPDNVVLLLGNHDLHYITDKIVQSSRFDFDISQEVSVLFGENRSLFQFACQDENCIFTHAGISHKWFVDDFKGDFQTNIADQLNHPKPGQERFLYACGMARGGFDKRGGVFWADIRELYEPLKGYTQIVGHNRVKDISDHTNRGGRIIFCDCLFNKHYLKI
jgi:hypothetical protein